MIEQVLDNTTQKKLRENSIISSEEVAMQVGDLFLAENVISKERRRIPPETINITETDNTNNTSSKTLLKG